MRISRGRTQESNIPTASMADIAFLLIIFFMVTAIDQPDKVSLKLPKSFQREDIPRGSAFISVDMEGMIRFSSGKEPSQLVANADEIYFKAVQLIAFNPNAEFIVKAGGTMQYRYVDEIIDALRRAKSKAVWLLTEQSTVS